MKVEVAVLGSPVPNSPYGLCGRKVTLHFNCLSPAPSTVSRPSGSVACSLFCMCPDRVRCHCSLFCVQTKCGVTCSLFYLCQDPVVVSPALCSICVQTECGVIVLCSVPYTSTVSRPNGSVTDPCSICVKTECGVTCSLFYLCQD